MRIGDQLWMSENLNVGKMIKGLNKQRNDDIIEKYCYRDKEYNCEKYGGLYQWDEMMDYDIFDHGQSICPPGWRLPTEKDFTYLQDFSGGKISGIHLKKERHHYKKDKYHGYVENTTEFSALLSGIRSPEGVFKEAGISGLFWTSTTEKMGKSKYRGNGAIRFKLHKESPETSIYYSDKNNGLSVRCLKD